MVASGGATGSVHLRPRGTSGWTTVALEPENFQNQAIVFHSAESFLLAGTYRGVYRAPLDGQTWWPMMQTEMSSEADVIALASYGARIYAGVVHQGYFIYSSDDQGGTWTLRTQVPVLIYNMLGSNGRLWVGRADGLWYYDLDPSPTIFQTLLMGTLGGLPAQKGSMLGRLYGDVLQLVGQFAGLDASWTQIDLFRGDPRAGGEFVRNVSLTVPEGGGRSGGIDAELALTASELADLLNGAFYLSIRTPAGSTEDVVGRIQILPMHDPDFSTAPLWTFLRGAVERTGRMILALERNALRLIAHGILDSPVHQVTLNRGHVGEPGEHLATLWLNFIAGPDTDFGFDQTIPLSEALLQDLHDGLFYVEAQATGGERTRSRLFLAANLAPEESDVTLPDEGATVTIGATGGGESADPAARLLEVAFTLVEDPEGSPVEYIWQVSRSTEFSRGATVALAADPGSTSLSLTVGAAADLFDAAWPGDTPPLHTPVPFYQRMITTDGSLYTLGPVSSISIVRGTITSNEPQEGLPDRFVLRGNYPNPFNPVTTIIFDLQAPAEVRVELYDVLGRKVRTLPMGTVSAGAGRTVSIDGTGLASGTYVYRLVMERPDGTQAVAGKMMLVR